MNSTGLWERYPSEYSSWSSMIQRCTNPKLKCYRHYGGRGIGVCGRWRASFKAFLEDMGPKPDGVRTIERIDNQRGYEPGNCKWATMVEQRHNRIDPTGLEAFGERLTLDGWSRRFGISRQSIRIRLRKGLSPEEAVSSPKKR